MVHIQQHGEAGVLFDLNMFFGDIATFVPVNQWKFSVHECMGEGGDEVELRGDCQAATV